MAIDVAGFQLKSLAELLQKVYSAVDLSQITRAIMLHVRDAIPAGKRNSKEFKSVERRLLLALEDLYLASLNPEIDEEAAPTLTHRISTAEAYYIEQLHAAARIVDKHAPGSADGEILRTAADAIAEAAQDIVERRSNEFALSIARDQEQLGAAPSLLFQLDGRIVWANHSLTQLCENRKLDRARLLQAASRFAAPICAELRRRETPETGKKLRKRAADLGIHFHAQVKHRNGNAGEALLFMEVSEAKRKTQLSPREQQVARLVAEHGSYQKAADISGVSLDSVRTYVRRIYRKLGVSNRLDLKARLIRVGLVDKDT